MTKYCLTLYGCIAAVSAYADGVAITTLPTNPVTMVGQESGLCLQPSGGSTNAGAAIVQGTCNSSTAQQFNINFVTRPEFQSGLVTIANVASGFCFQIANYLVEGSQVLQQICNTAVEAQQFRVLQFNNNYWVFQSREMIRLNGRDYNLCIGIQDGSTTAGANLVSWPCLDYDGNKQFLLSTPTSF